MILLYLLLALLAFSPPAWGAEVKVTEFDADATPTGDDLLMTVDDPAGTPTSKKATVTNVLAVHTGDTTDAHDATAISVDSTNLDGTGTEVQTVLEEIETQLDTHVNDATDAHNITAITNGVSAAAAFATDESCLRADGTGKGAQATSTNCTIDNNGNITAASITTGGGTSSLDGTAGAVELGQGTAPSGLGTTSIQVVAPTSVTSYRVVLPTAASTGFLKLTNSANILTGTIEAAASGAFLHTFRPQQNEPPSANFATADTRNGHPVLDFDSSTQEAAVFSGVMNRGYSGGNLTVNIWFACSTNTTASEEVVWEAQWEKLNTQDLDSDSFAAVVEASPATCSTTAGVMTMATITFTSSEIDGLTAGDPFRLKILRDPANAGDDLDTLDAELRMVEIVQ